MEKNCKKCGELKPLEAFHKLKLNRDGRTGGCKVCINAESRERSALPENKAKKAAYGKMWKENHRGEWRLIHAKHQRNRNAERRPEDIIARGVRSKIWRQLKTGKYGKRTFELLGYTREELMKHLESKFKPGMTWANYGQWHIDHVVPQSVFNIVSYNDFDFKRCWALNNLQPLWAKDNYMKRDKLTQSFQPSLSLGVAS